MRAYARLLAALLGAAVSAMVPASSTVANPLGLFYDNSFTNFEAYEHPTAMLVAGNCNRDDPRFQQARAAPRAKSYTGGLVTAINEPIKTISCPHSAANLGICNLRSCIVASSGKRNSKNCHRSLIWTIRPNLTTKLNSESNTSVRISSDNDLNGAATAE